MCLCVCTQPLALQQRPVRGGVRWCIITVPARLGSASLVYCPPATLSTTKLKLFLKSVRVCPRAYVCQRHVCRLK